MEKACVVYVTTPSEEEGQKLIQGLLDQHLIACGLIVPGATSFFIWQGQIQQEKEVVLWLKAASSHQQAIQDYIQAHHSYELPFVAFFDPLVSPELASWLHNS